MSKCEISVHSFRQSTDEHYILIIRAESSMMKTTMDGSSPINLIVFPMAVFSHQH